MQVQYLFGDTPFTLYLQYPRGANAPLVLVNVAGDPVDRLQFNFMRLVEASDGEIAALRRDGYWAAGPRLRSDQNAAAAA